MTNRNRGRDVDAAEAARSLSAKDRAALASHTCDYCDAPLLIIEIGRHYREEHPTLLPRVTPRKAGPR